MAPDITLATQHGWAGTWIGSTIGMVAADALAILIGHMLGRRLPERAIRYGAAALFAIFGLWLLVDAVGSSPAPEIPWALRAWVVATGWPRGG